MTYKKVKYKWVTDLNLKAKTIKPYFFKLSCRKIFVTLVRGNDLLGHKNLI